MQYYDVEVLKGDERVSAKRRVGLPDSRDAWPMIAELAERIEVPGCRIRVTDQSGQIIILIGVAAVQSTFSSEYLAMLHCTKYGRITIGPRFPSSTGPLFMESPKLKK
jgi:hypothetical protein